MLNDKELVIVYNFLKFRKEVFFMDFLVILSVLLCMLLLIVSIKKARVKHRFTQYIINNGGYEIDFINNKEISFYESVKLLNKKYKIGLVNAFSVVNCLREM